MSASLECQEGPSEIKMEDVNLSGQNKLFVNGSLSPYYKVLWSKSKRLHCFSKIFTFYISSDAVNIKVSENSDDFGKHFPDIDILRIERSD